MTCTSLCSSHIASILRVLVYIEAHLDEPLLLEHLAQVARVSPFHFHRLFRAYTGETCMGYIQRLRLQRAEEKLRYTEDSITRISQDVGYETPAGFSKFFQQTLGRSPREYRKAIQPVVKTMVARALSSPAWTPQYVVRKKESVLFVRRIGDYKETPELAFQTLYEFLDKKAVDKRAIQAFYSIALDDPNIVERKKCRFDACVQVLAKITPEGEIGEKQLSGGLFACFDYYGPSSGIEGAFDEIYRSWYSTSTITLSDKESICEHIGSFEEEHEEKKRHTKIYIPVTRKK